MNHILKRINELHAISEALEPSNLERVNYIEQVSSYANNFIDGLEQTKAYSADQENLKSLKLFTGKKSLPEILKIYNNEIASKGIKPASGGHIGYIPGGGIYSSGIADFLADITNEYVGMHFSSPGGVAVEQVLLDWMKDIFSFPINAVGNLTSGGSIANLIAMTAARDKYQIKNEVISKSVVYLSHQVHHCIQKALKIIGLEDVIINYLELDDYSKINIRDLKSKIALDKENGLVPFLIVASAGTTDTGAIDPLNAIGVVAKENNLWYHVDAAYGGFFILIDHLKHKFIGIEMADSLVVDPHKGLFLPYGLGAVLVKDEKAVFHSHMLSANYMQDARTQVTAINPADVSPELSKHFRGLRLWLPLQLHGIEPFIACLEEKILLTNYFREQLVTIGFRVGPEPDLSVSYFWYPSSNQSSNKFNQSLLKELHKDGEIFFSSTVIKEKFVIRMALLSFRTKLITIDKALEMLKRALEKINLKN